MKVQKIIFAIAISCFVLTGCKKEIKEVKKENVSLAISGMTCEIGCAKTIQSKLSKKEGVIDAKVVFTDSIANIEFDANKTSKKDLIAFVSGIAGGELYKASETSKKACKKDCKMACCANKTAEACKKSCDMKGSKTAATCKGKDSETCKKDQACSDACKEKNELKADKTACKTDCKMACCTDQKS